MGGNPVGVIVVGALALPQQRTALDRELATTECAGETAVLKTTADRMIATLNGNDGRDAVDGKTQED